MTWTTFTADNAELTGWATGDGEQLALVLHGGPGLTDYMEGAADEMLDGGDGALRVARYQQRGQAPSSLEGELSVAQQVADTLAVMDALGAERALLAGHSWGAHLAMHIAVAAPERVSGLLLIDALGAIGDGGAGTMGATIGARIGDKGAAAMAELATLGLENDEAELRQLAILWPGYFKDAEAAPPMPDTIGISEKVNAAVMSDAMALLGDDVLANALPQLAIPNLHMIGLHSPIDPDANRQTAALMKDAIVEEFDTGHFIWIEQPGSVVEATRRLLGAMS